MLRLQEQSLDWSLAHVLKFGDTDVFPVPFEYQAIKFDWKKVKEALLAEDVLEWKTRPTRVLMSPKARNGFRSITQLDPLDFIVFVALIKDIAKDKHPF